MHGWGVISLLHLSSCCGCSPHPLKQLLMRHSHSSSSPQTSAPKSDLATSASDNDFFSPAPLFAVSGIPLVNLWSSHTSPALAPIKNMRENSLLLLLGNRFQESGLPLTILFVSHPLASCIQQSNNYRLLMNAIRLFPLLAGAGIVHKHEYLWGSSSSNESQQHNTPLQFM